MGHYEGVEERIAEKRKQNDAIIKPLSDEVFAATWAQSKMEHAIWKMHQMFKEVKYWEEICERIGVTPNEKALEVLRYDSGDYSYKTTHVKSIRTLLFGDASDE